MKGFNHKWQTVRELRGVSNNASASGVRRIPPLWHLIVGLTTSALAFVSGCTVGPNYRRPEVKAPSAWSEPLEGGETNGAAVQEWWRTFNDSQLNEFIGRAVKANLQLRAARARVLEARAQRVIARSGFWPTAETSAAYSRNQMSASSFIPLPPGTPLNYNLYQVGFDATWELDIFGGIRRGAEAANAELAAAEFSRRDILVSLLAETARNFFEARALRQRLVIAEENIAAQRDTVKLTRERYTAGVASELDVQQASALLASTEAAVPALKTALVASANRLAVLLGEVPGELSSRFQTNQPFPALPHAVAIDLPSDLLRRRPDVNQAERQLAAATARIGVAVADLFPHVSLAGSGGFESVSLGKLFSPSSGVYSIGPSITWRFFEGGRLRANVRVQNARQEQALANYEQVVLNAFEDVENALAAYAQEQKRYAALQESVKAQWAALRLAQDLYRNGLADFLRVLDSTRALYQDEDALLQSQRSVYENLIALYKALGGGWEIEP